MLHMAFGSGWTTVLLGAAGRRAGAGDALAQLSGARLALRRRGRSPCSAASPSIRPSSAPSSCRRRRSSTGCCPAMAFRRSPSALPPGSSPAPPTAGRVWPWKRRQRCLRLLTIAMLVRHAMHGGVIDTGAPTLAEQAIYTLIAIGAGAILVASTCARRARCCAIGSIAAGVRLGRLHRRPAFRGAQPALHRRIDRPDPGVQPAVPCLSAAGDRQPAGWRSMRATSGRNGMRRCWRWSRHCLPSPMRRCRSGGCSRASSSACGAASASSKPTLIPRCGWSSAWRCSLPASG